MTSLQHELVTGPCKEMSSNSEILLNRKMFSPMATGSPELGNETAGSGLKHLPKWLKENYPEDPHLCYPATDSF